MRRRGLALALCGLLPCLAAGAQAPSATAPEGAATLSVEVAAGEARIGDRLRADLVLRAASPLSSPPRFPVWEENWGDAEILEVTAPIDAGDGTWRQTLTLVLFTTGAATLPAVEVRLPRAGGETETVRTEPVTVAVASVLPPAEEEVAPQPPAPVMPLPLGAGFWWTLAVLGLACTALAWWLWRTASRVREAVAALTASPIEALERALERLRAETDPERLFTGLSLELRRYVGRSLGFPAAEGTTTEIQRRLRERSLPPELTRRTIDLLREADRVKFARGPADRERATRRLAETEHLAAEVESWLHPEPAAEASPEAAA